MVHPAEMAAEAAGMAVEAATEARCRAAALICRTRAYLDSFQSKPPISLELLENAVLGFASGAALLYRKAPHQRWACRFR
jgi:hypothetical protein